MNILWDWSISSAAFLLLGNRPKPRAVTATVYTLKTSGIAKDDPVYTQNHFWLHSEISPPQKEILCWRDHAAVDVISTCKGKDL